MIGKKEESNTSDPWKSTLPKDGESHTMTVGKRSFTWCPHHKYWGGHMAADCFKVAKHYPLNKDCSSERCNSPTKSCICQHDGGPGQ